MIKIFTTDIKDEIDIHGTDHKLRGIDKLLCSAKNIFEINLFKGTDDDSYNDCCIHERRFVYFYVVYFYGVIKNLDKNNTVLLLDGYDTMC